MLIAATSRPHRGQLLAPAGALPRPVPQHDWALGALRGSGFCILGLKAFDLGAVWAFGLKLRIAVLPAVEFLG